MKQLQLFGLIVFGVFLIGCESTQTAGGMGNQERKRLAAVQQEQRIQVDETESNLWYAHQDKLNRDSRPLQEIEDVSAALNGR
ncbi:MAG: hypothetical protein ABI925_11230 [Verrucomicrobiota bacterium]